jgi:hypothetical protein
MCSPGHSTSARSAAADPPRSRVFIKLRDLDDRDDDHGDGDRSA